MNNCDMYQELISRLVDGELSREEYAALDAHMENCAECSAMYAVFASLSDIIGGEDEALPEDLHENIMAGVRRSAMIKNNKRRLSRPLRNVLAAAACAAFVLFASRGLAPEKAAETVLNESQTAAMDAQVEQAAPAAAEAAPEQLPAISETPAPTAPVNAVASPVPTKDIYLETEKDEAKSAAGNTNKTTNSVVVTPRPTEIPVDTPVTVNTPKPTVTPAPVTITATPTATPVPETAVPEPAAIAETPAQQSEAPAPAATEVPAAESAQPQAAPEAPAATEAALPLETESPSLTQRIFSFFSVSRPSASNDEAAPAEEESPAEPSAEPEEAMMFAAAPQEAAEDEAAEEEKEKPIRLDGIGRLFDLENLLDGVDAERPEGEADQEYLFVLMEPEDDLEDYQVRVFVYGDKIYYEQRFSEDEAVFCLSECKLEDFEKFLDSLSDEEKGTEPSPSPTAPVEAPEEVPDAVSAAPADDAPQDSAAPTAVPEQ